MMWLWVEIQEEMTDIAFEVNYMLVKVLNRAAHAFVWLARKQLDRMKR